MFVLCSFLCNKIKNTYNFLKFLIFGVFFLGMVHKNSAFILSNYLSPSVDGF